MTAELTESQLKNDMMSKFMLGAVETSYINFGLVSTIAGHALRF